MRAGARGRRAGGSHARGKRLRGDGRAGGRLPTAVPRRVRGRPRGFVPARAPARGDTPAGPVASPRPPGPADSRPGRNDGRDAKAPCAARPGRGGRPGLGAPRAGRGAARAGPGDGRPGLRPRGGAPARGRDPVPARHVVGRAHADRQAREAPVPAPPGPAAPRRPGRRRVAGDCLAALSAAESAEVACDGPGARAEGIARAPGPGPPVVAPVRARGAGPPLGARPRRRGGRPLPPLVRAKGRVLPRPRALGGPGRREPEAGPRPGERTGARAQASRRGRLGPRAGQPGVPQEGRGVGAPRDPRARAGLPGKAPRTPQGAGLPRPGAPRGQHRHGRRDGAHAAPRRQGRAGGRRAGGRGGPRRLSSEQRAVSSERAWRTRVRAAPQGPDDSAGGDARAGWPACVPGGRGPEAGRRGAPFPMRTGRAARAIPRLPPAAAPEEARCGPHELRYPRTWDCAPARRSRSGPLGRRCGSAIEG